MQSYDIYVAYSNDNVLYSVAQLKYNTLDYKLAVHSILITRIPAKSALKFKTHFQ